MEDLSAWVKMAVGRSTLFWLYGKVFRVSHLEENDDVWVDINEVGFSTKIRVRTEAELAEYIRNHVLMSPLFNEMILFNVKNAVCKNLHLQCESEE